MISPAVSATAASKSGAFLRRRSDGFPCDQNTNTVGLRAQFLQHGRPEFQIPTGNATSKTQSFFGPKNRVEIGFSLIKTNLDVELRRHFYNHFVTLVLPPKTGPNSKNFSRLAWKPVWESSWLSGLLLQPGLRRRDTGRSANCAHTGRSAADGGGSRDRLLILLLNAALVLRPAFKQTIINSAFTHVRPVFS